MKIDLSRNKRRQGPVYGSIGVIGRLEEFYMFDRGSAPSTNREGTSSRFQDILNGDKMCSWNQLRR